MTLAHLTTSPSSCRGRTAPSRVKSLAIVPAGERHAPHPRPSRRGIGLLVGRRASNLMLAGLLSLSFQLSPGQLLAQGRAIFTGSHDAEPLVAGFRRDILSQDADGFTLSNGTRGYRHFDDHSLEGTYPELDSDIHPRIV
ncbi:MAG: hypothetical protein V3T64_11405, partial [Myxococcota bacterium]